MAIPIPRPPGPTQWTEQQTLGTGLGGLGGLGNPTQRIQRVVRQTDGTERVVEERIVTSVGQQPQVVRQVVAQKESAFDMSIRDMVNQTVESIRSGKVEVPTWSNFFDSFANTAAQGAVTVTTLMVAQFALRAIQVLAGKLFAPK
jgi:hypothetical protein